MIEQFHLNVSLLALVIIIIIFFFAHDLLERLQPKTISSENVRPKTAYT